MSSIEVYYSSLSGLVSLTILLAFPACQTYKSLKTRTHRGLYGQYWIGISFLLISIMPFRWLLIFFPYYPLFEILSSLLLTFNKGFLLRYITQSLVAPLYKNSSPYISKLLHIFSSIISFFSICLKIIFYIKQSLF